MLTRNLSQIFLAERSSCKHKARCYVLDDELQRLSINLVEYSQTSVLKKIILTSTLLSHNRKRSVKLVSTQSCHICLVNSSSKFCHVCGLAVCISCATDNLLLYFLDKELSEQKYNLENVKWCIIGISGSIEKEPSTCLYHKICNACREDLMHKQLLLLYNKDSIDLGMMYTKFRDIHFNVHKELEAFISKCSDFKKPHLQSSVGSDNMRILRRSMVNIEDLLNDFWTIFLQFKDFKLTYSSEKFAVCCSNCTNHVLQCFVDTKASFRVSVNEIKDIVPVESFQPWQSISNKDSCLSALLYMKQLAFELLNLAKKFQIEISCLPDFTYCVDVILLDLKKHSEILGESFGSEDEVIMNTLLRENLHHKPLLSSVTRDNWKGHLKQLLVMRIQIVLANLEDRCSYKATVSTKDVVQFVLAQVLDCHITGR